METIGQKLNPLLVDIENTLKENTGIKPEFPHESLKAATRIFMDVITDKIFDLYESEKLDLEDGVHMASRCGEDLRKLIKTYTNIDPHDFYK